MSPRTKEQIMARIGELERQINTRVAATPLGPLGRRGFPWFSWIAAALGIGLYRFHDLLPLNAAAPFVARHALKLGIAGAAFAVLGLYLTIRFLLQRSVPLEGRKYREETRDVAALQKERQDLQQELKERFGA